MEIIVQISVVVALLTAIVNLYLKLRSAEDMNSDLVTKKVGQKFDVYKTNQKEVQTEKEKANEEKFKQLWLKLNSLDTQINGNAKYNAKGMIVDLEMIKLLLRQLMKEKDDENI